MEVKEAAQNPSKPFEEVIRGNLTVSSAATKHYLERARGNYVSALTGQYSEKKVETNIVDVSSTEAGHAFDHVAEAEKPTTPEQPVPLNTVFGKDMQMQFPTGLLKGSEKQFQAVKSHFGKTLSMGTISQLADMVDRLGVTRNELGSVSSDSGNGKESLKGLAENSSLQKTVESLKAELENLKREHSELKDKNVGAESASKSCQLRSSHCKPENNGCQTDKVKCLYEEAAQNKNETKHLNIKAKGLKRELNTLKSDAEDKKRPRITLSVNEDEECTVSALDTSENLPERMYTTCVSTSESSGKIMNSEDDLESSTQQPDKSNHLELGKLMTINGIIKSYEDGQASEFSIRDFVFSARNKDISKNWPFSQENLQLCLKHEVTNVLPPFQPVYAMREGSAKRCLAEKSVSTEESRIDERPTVMKKHWIRGDTINRRWNLEFTPTAVICQSEVGSVSTSNLPLSEAVSDEQEASASAANKTNNSISQIINKKCRVAMKLPINSRRTPPEDITSARMTPSDIMASKICPVCESFSSSSNTTLNAHIDQCLSSQSNPNWMKNTKVVVPRVKPRKIRSMADICATAPSSTLEDLDRRNGSNWATNLEIPALDTELLVEGSNHKVSSKYTVNNRNDGSVYIDSSGRKIRILSKFNEMAPSSFQKSREDPKVRKQSHKGKKCRLFSASRKRRLVKHLKYLRVTRQRKQFLSRKASAVEEATCAGHESHMEHQSSGSFGKGLKVHGQKNHLASEASSNCTSSKIITLAKTNDHEATTKAFRYNLRPVKDLPVISDHKVTEKTNLKKPSHLPKKPLCSIQRRLGTSAFDSAEAEQKHSGSACGKSIIRLKLKVPGFNGENPKECARETLNSGATPASSLEREIEIQPDVLDNAGSSKLLLRCRAYPFEEMRSCNSGTELLSPNHSYGCSRDGDQSDAKQGCSKDGLRDTNRFSDGTETSHGNNNFGDPVTSTSLPIGETDTRLNPSFEPESQKLADASMPLSKIMQCTDKFQSPLSVDESDGYFFQHGLVDGQTLYRNVSDFERSEVKIGNANFSFGQASSLMEVDPIPIPGPPGSDLPSFSDMGSEDFQRTSSLSTGLEQSFGDEDNVVDGNSSDSRLSATVTIFNLGLTVDHVYPGCLSASSPLDSLTVFSESADAKAERVVSSVSDLKEFRDRGQQCCCSRKEVIPWSAATTIQDSQFEVEGMTSSVNFPREDFPDSTLTKWPHKNLVNSVQMPHQNIASPKISDDEAARSCRTGNCDSASPAPVLRLMGKDLMVPNHNEIDPSMIQVAQNVFMNRQVDLFAENSSKHDRNWEHPSSQSPDLIGSFPYEQDPHFFFDVGPSNMINNFRSPNYTSSDMYLNKHMHSSFSVPGAPLLQRLGNDVLRRT